MFLVSCLARALKLAYFPFGKNANLLPSTGAPLFRISPRKIVYFWFYFKLQYVYVCILLSSCANILSLWSCIIFALFIYLFSSMFAFFFVHNLNFSLSFHPWLIITLLMLRETNVTFFILHKQKIFKRSSIDL